MASLSEYLSNLGAQDPMSQITLLTSMVSEASQGKDFSPVASLIIHGAFTSSKVHPTAKRLAYDLLKSVNLTEADSQLVARAIRADACGATVDPELCAAALASLSLLPSPQIVYMYEVGDLASLLDPLVRHKDAWVRSASVGAWHEALLRPSILSTASQSAASANSYQEHWIKLSDSILDEDPRVVGPSIVAVTELLSAGLSASSSTPAGFLLQRLGGLMALRVAGALPSVLECCSLSPSYSQVVAAKMLLLITQHFTEPPELNGGSIDLTFEGSGSGSSMGLPTLGSFLTSSCGFLHQRLGSCDGALRLESARSLLSIISLVKSYATRVLSGSSSSNWILSLLPEPWACTAVTSLMELEGRQLIEGGLEDIVQVITSNLKALPASYCPRVIRQLLPLISQVVNVPSRMQAYSLIFAHAISEEERDPARQSSCLTLTLLLTDPYLSSLLNVKAGTTAPGAMGWSASLTREARPIAEGKEDEKDKKKGTGGGFFSSLGIGGGGGVKKDPQPQEQEGAGKGAGSGGTTSAAVAKGTETAKAAGAAAANAAAIAADKAKQGWEKGRDAISSLTQETPRSATLADAPNSEAAAARTERILPRKFLSASTHRHEVLCCLLDSLQRTERAEEAARICIESTLVAAKDLKHQDPYPKPSDPSSHTPVGGSSSRGHHEIDGLGFASLSSREARASAWLRMTRTVLQATLLCLSWEPVITPAITTQPSNEAQGRAPADFCSAPSDLWLKLFGAASQCARALGETLSVRLTPDQRLQRGGPDSDPSLILPPQGQGRLHEATPQGLLLSKLLQQQQHQGHASSTHQEEGEGEGEQVVEAPLTPSTPPVPPSPYQEATLKLLSIVDVDSKELQSMLKAIVRGSRGSRTSRALRMRIAWTATHHLILPTSLDETWELLLKSLADVMTRAKWRWTSDSELMAAAELGCLSRSERQSWPKNKPFDLDILAAAALCERADLEMSSIVTGLACLQHLVSLLHTNLANAAAKAASGTSDVAFAAVAGADASLLAARIEAVAREVQSSPEVQQSPHLKEWASRIMRMCGAVAAYKPAEAIRAAERERDGAAYDDDDDSDQDPRSDKRKKTPFGGVAGYGGSDDDSDDDRGRGRGASLAPLDQIMLPPSYLRGPLRQSQSIKNKAGGAGLGFTNPGQGRPFPSPSFQQRHALLEGGEGGEGEGEDVVFTGTVQTIVPAPGYLSHSTTGSCIWGYPFTGPRPSTLFSSKRSRRHRAILDLLSSTATSLAPPARRADGSIYRLESKELWREVMPLPVSGGGPQGLGYEMAWEEISGPADPLLVRVAVQGGSDSNSNHPRGWVPESDPEVDEPGRGSGFTDGLGGLTLTLEVSSRLDWGLPSPPGPGPGSAGGSGNGGVLHGIIAGVEVQVKVKGPALVDKRGVSWTLPRMTPGDKVRRTIGVRVNGYDPVEVHVMLLPCPHPPSALAPASFPTPLACKPWRISSVSPQALLLSPPSTMKANGGKDKGAGPLTAAEFFRLWACLPARTDLSGFCSWPGSEGQCLALSSLLRRPQLECTLVQSLPASGIYQAAFSTCTVQGDRILILIFTQLLPVALSSPQPSESTSSVSVLESPGSTSSVPVCQIMVRSGSAEAIRSIQIANCIWIEDLSLGTIVGAVGNGGCFTSGLGPHTGGRPKPPMDPRLMELHSSFVAHGQTGHLAKEGAKGGKAPMPWIKGTALCEWQRLAAGIEV